LESVRSFVVCLDMFFSSLSITYKNLVSHAFFLILGRHVYRGLKLKIKTKAFQSIVI